MARTRRFSPERLVGLAFVISLHVALFYGLLSQQLIPLPAEAATLFVNFIASPESARIEAAKPIPAPVKTKPLEKTESPQQLTLAPAAPSESIAALSPVKSAPLAESQPTPFPAGPVNLASELALACHERPAPAYPAMSRRLGETGIVVVRAELSESGNVLAAKVDRSSGFPRLDEAALHAVRQWRCTAPTRNAQAVGALALQPFNFVLQGN
jgi:protein TonB